MNSFKEIAKAHAPCYIYDGAVVSAQCEKLTQALAGFEFLYSVKTNPHPLVVKNTACHGFGADAASAQEVEIALRSGMHPHQIYYSAPGKTAAEIAQCIEKSVIIADSFSEIQLIDAAAKRLGQAVKIGLRINPDFTMDADALTPSKFGIDVEELWQVDALLQRCENVKVAGIHIHLKSQETDFKKIGTYYEKCFALAQRINGLPGVNIEFINFGSGIGALYDKEKDTPADLQQLCAMARGIITQNESTLGAKLIIETGRFIVCNAGAYYTEIVDIKHSRGVKYYIIKNGMNGFLRPPIANLVKKVSGGGETGGYEPLFTSHHAFDVFTLGGGGEKETVTVVGNLCTALDVVASDVTISKAKIGDVLAITNAGSYAYSLSPLLFSGHPAPKEIYVDEAGTAFID